MEENNNSNVNNETKTEEVEQKFNNYNAPKKALTLRLSTLVLLIVVAFLTGNIINSMDMPDLNKEELYKIYSCINKIESIKDKDKVLYYIFRTKLFKSSRKLIKHLESSGFDIQSWFLNTYNIAHPISNKIDSVRFIQSLLGINDDSIITIGDAKDDLEMIKNYYSYGIISYLPNFEVLRNCDVKVKSLNETFKYINKNI